MSEAKPMTAAEAAAMEFFDSWSPDSLEAQGFLEEMMSEGMLEKIVESQRQQAADQTRIETAQALMVAGWLPIETAPLDERVITSCPWPGGGRSIEILEQEEEFWSDIEYSRFDYKPVAWTPITHPGETNQPSEILKLAVAAYELHLRMFDPYWNWTQRDSIKDFREVNQSLSPATRTLLEALAKGEGTSIMAAPSETPTERLYRETLEELYSCFDYWENNSCGGISAIKKKKAIELKAIAARALEQEGQG